MDGVLTSSQVQPVPPQSSAAPHSTNLSSQHRHTLSEDSTDSSNMMAQPPPTLLRLPPDGHEFPPEYRDSASNSTTATIVYQVGQMNGSPITIIAFQNDPWKNSRKIFWKTSYPNK